MVTVPSAQFAHDIKAKTVAGIIELGVCRIVGEAHGVHVHALDEFHVLNVECLVEGASTFGPEAVAVDTANIHLFAVDIQSVVVTGFNGAETEFVFLDVQGLALVVDQCKFHLVTVGCFGSPQLGIVDLETDVGMVAALAHVGGLFGHFLAVHVGDERAHLGTLQHMVDKHIGVECAVGLGVDGCALNVEGRFAHDEHRAEYAAEVPVVGTAFGKVHTCILALFADRHLQQVFLVAEEHTVGHVEGETVEGSLMHGTCLALVDLHFGVGHRTLEHQVDVMVFPFLGQGELIFVHALLIGDAVGEGFAIELHAILVGAEALQFPARGNADFCPFTRIVAAGALEIPLYHVVAASTAQILAAGVNIVLCQHSCHGRKCQK